MKLLTVFLIAVGLSLDAVAVSMTSGLAMKELKVRHVLRIAFFFGFFQMAMPVIGWLAGMSLRVVISRFDHWLAFIILTVIGVKMIWESRLLEHKKKAVDPRRPAVLLALALATSIDALAVGLSFSFLNMVIVTPVLIIGAVTFVLSFLGVIVGNRFGALVGKKIEILGGIILIGIGVKILLEHL